ncbi:unnamed protein product, partial [Ectocarpus sp. 12 AP-2014]
MVEESKGADNRGHFLEPDEIIAPGGRSIYQSGEDKDPALPVAAAATDTRTSSSSSSNNTPRAATEWVCTFAEDAKTETQNEQTLQATESAVASDLYGADLESDDEDEEGGGDEYSSDELQMAAFLENAEQSVNKRRVDTMNFLGITEAEAELLLRRHIYYAAVEKGKPLDETMILDPDKDVGDEVKRRRKMDARVVEDFEAVWQPTRKREIRSQFVATKLLAAYVDHRTAACSEVTIKAMQASWNEPCSWRGVFNLATSVDPRRAWKKIKKADEDKSRDWTGWKEGFEQLVGRLGKCKFTNGQAMCLRGRRVDAEDEESEASPFPLRPLVPVPDDDVDKRGVLALGFPAVDNVFESSRQVAAELAAARSATGGGSSSAQPQAPPSSSRRLSSDSSTVRLGSALRGGEGRARLSIPSGGISDAQRGVFGGRQAGVLGPEKDTVTSNHRVALFFRTLPLVVARLFQENPDVRITVMQTDGRLQELASFVKRVEGDDLLTTRLREAAKHCPEADSEVVDPMLEGTHHECLMPPSTRVVCLAMQCMTSSELPTSLLTDARIVAFLENEVGVDPKKIRREGDAGLSYNTILQAVTQTQLWAFKVYGMRVFIPGSETMTPAQYEVAKNQADRELSIARRSLKEQPRALKEPSKR